MTRPERPINNPFGKLGYSAQKDGSVKPIILTGKPQPAAAPPPAPAKPKTYFEVRDEAAAKVEAAERERVEREEWEKGLRGNP